MSTPTGDDTLILDEGSVSFRQFETLFANGRYQPRFKCIATPWERRCSKSIHEDQLWNATAIARTPSHLLTLHDVRDIICCVLCLDHQKPGNNYWKNKVEASWEHDFQDRRNDGLFFKRPRDGRRSPYQLSPGVLTPGRLQRPQTPSLSFGSTPSSTASPDGSYFGRQALRRPDFHRDQGGSVGTSYSPQPSQINDPSPDLVDYFSESPSAAPSRRRNRNIVRNVAPNAVEEQTPPSTPPSRGRSHPPPVQGTWTEGSPLENGSQALPPKPPFTDLSSIPQPHTVASKVRSLLTQRILPQATTGSIYVAPVQNTDCHTVKIGITISHWKTRLRSVQRAHDLKFDMDTAWHDSGIPIMQLERLEKIAQSFLAASQRRLIIPTSDRARRTAKEYFKVSTDVAVNTVSTWLRIMRKLNLGEGVQLNNSIFPSLQSDPDAAAFMNPAIGSQDDRPPSDEEYRTRLEIWERYLVNDGGSVEGGDSAENALSIDEDISVMDVTSIENTPSTNNDHPMADVSEDGELLSPGDTPATEHFTPIEDTSPSNLPQTIEISLPRRWTFWWFGYISIWMLPTVFDLPIRSGYIIHAILIPILSRRVFGTVSG